ncbi:MAG: hypothetical protein AAGI46_15035 [Planctomycetota bacterium]
MADERDPIEKAPFANRLGTVRVWGYNDWTAAAVDLGEKPPKGAERANLKALLSGELDYPAAKFVLLIKLKGHRWALAAPSWAEGIGGYGFGQWLSTRLDHPVIHVGHNDTASASFFSLHGKGEELIHFESCGEEYHARDPDEIEMPTRFNSDRHDKDWWRSHANENDAIQALLREFDAYVPLLFAAEDDAKLRPDAFPTDTLSKEHIAWAAMLPATPGRIKKGESALLAKQLFDAIKRVDPHAVEEVLAAGADPDALPGGQSNPLSHAIWMLQLQRDVDGDKRASAVIDALLDAQANPDGTESANPLCAIGDSAPFKAEKLVRAAEQLIRCGANVNRSALQGPMKQRGTALHTTASSLNVPILRLLLQHGADPRIANENGQTPREMLIQAADGARSSEWLGDEDVARMERDQAQPIALLEAAENGIRPNEWMESARAARREREQLLQSVREKFEADEQVMAEVLAGQRIELTERKGYRWADPAARDRLAGSLRAAGFKTRVGVYDGELAAGSFLVLALMDRKRNAFAAVYEHAGNHWADIVRWHEDGSMLTVTNAPTMPAAEAELPMFRKIRLKDADAAELVAALDAEPAEDVARLRPDEFVERFERAYADEMAARRQAR